MKQNTEAFSEKKKCVTSASVIRRFLVVCMAFNLSVAPALAQEGGMFDQVDAMAGTLVGWIASAFFFPIYTSSSGTEIPLVVAWLVVGAIFFTIRMGFINFRGFKHAIDVVRGKYDNTDDEGEVTQSRLFVGQVAQRIGRSDLEVDARCTAIRRGWLAMGRFWNKCSIKKVKKMVFQSRVIGAGVAGLESKVLTEPQEK